MNTGIQRLANAYAQQALVDLGNGDSILYLTTKANLAGVRATCLMLDLYAERLYCEGLLDLLTDASERDSKGVAA